MKLHIYLFRHGQTYYNRDHYFTGWKDSKLTPRGFQDARKVAQKLKSKRIDIGIHSGLSRSRDTLREVLKFHPECRKIMIDPRMKERSYGDLSGHSHESFAKQFGEHEYRVLLHWHKLDHLSPEGHAAFVEKYGEHELALIRRSHTMKAPHGESMPMVERRVKAFIKDLVKMMKQKRVNVAIAAHGNSIRAWRKIWDKLSVEQEMKLENPWDDYFEYTVDC